MRPPAVLRLVVNSFIEGTIYQEKLFAWKKIHEPHQQGKQLGRVGTGYLRQFVKRHEGVLDSKIARRFGVNHSEWMNSTYLEKMYKDIYTIVVCAGVATRRLDTPVAYDFHGNIVDVGSESQYGLPSDIFIDYQDHILFGDETGINTNQMDDGQVGGAKYLVNIRD